MRIDFDFIAALAQTTEGGVADVGGGKDAESVLLLADESVTIRCSMQSMKSR